MLIRISPTKACLAQQPGAGNGNARQISILEDAGEQLRLGSVGTPATPEQHARAPSNRQECGHPLMKEVPAARLHRTREIPFKFDFGYRVGCRNQALSCGFLEDQRGTGR